MSKLRVWWIPQIGMDGEPFYIPVNTPLEGRKLMDILGAYDMYQYENDIKPDYSNTGGLEMWDEDDKEWCDWYDEDGNDLDDYIEENYEEECEEFSQKLYGQIRR